MENKLDWFNEARYGMFIHWGPYSVAARGEWVANRERIPKEEYAKEYTARFTAEKYDPREWVKLAKAAGMKYMVLTTRHHDGFALWNTKTTDFNAVKRGPKRDLIREFADAVREGGLKLGFYFSVADWYHPDYPNAYARDWPLDWKDEESRKRFVAYYRAQLEELMTRYGKVDLLWYDGCIPGGIDGEEVNTLVKTLQPHILINNRNGEPWDFQCCEQAIRPSGPGVAWEACMTLNDNWGYHAGDFHYKSARDVVFMLVQTAAGAGNLLLNVGPRADGTIPEEASEILLTAGKWLKKNGEFLYSSTRSPFTNWISCGKMTTKGHRVYLHLFQSTKFDICVAEIKNKVLSARYLETGDKIPFDQDKDRLFLKMPGLPTAIEIAVTVVLEVEGEPEAVTPPSTFWIPG